jgi:hypothetical protein
MSTWQGEWTFEIIRAVIIFFLGLASGSILTWLADRRVRATRVLDRYLVEADRQREAQDEAGFRMGLEQRSGASELSRRHLNKLAARVVAHGPKNPLIGDDFFTDWRKDTYRLLRWANIEGIDLSNEFGILQRLAAEADGIINPPKKP